MKYKIKNKKYSLSAIRYPLSAQGGQVMLIGVIMLSGALLSAGAIAGLLTVYQIRQASDVVNSAKAFFAADAALEWKSYSIMQGEQIFPVFQDANIIATATSTLVGDENILRSQGYSGTASRALETIFIASQENTAALCSDLVDNDGDGKIDLADPDCAAFIVPENTEALCTDGKDNDGDNLVDTAQDPDCPGYVPPPTP